MFRSLSRALPKVAFPQPAYFSMLSPALTASFGFSKSKTQIFKSPELDPSSTAYAVMRQVGLQKHLNKMYKTTIVSFTGALGVSYLMAASNFALLSPGLCFGIGAIGSLASVIAFTFTKSQRKMVTDANGNQYPTSENSPYRLGLYSTFVGCSGLLMAPMLGHYFLMNPVIIPLALGLTTTIVSGSSLYAYTKPKNSLLWLGGPLTGALISLIGVQLISLGAAWIYGPNLFSLMAHRADLYIGTGIFTAFVAYDTHVAIQNYEEGDADHLGASMSMFLNFQNIFLRMLQIVSSFYGDN